MKKPLNEYSMSEIDHAIDQWVICIRHAERNRAILKRHMFDGIPYETLAEEFDLQPRQIQNIVYKTQELLFKHL